MQLYGPATPSRLAKWTGLSSGGVAVALDRLEKAGYTRREPNPTDRRSLIVTLVLVPVRMRKTAAIYGGRSQPQHQLRLDQASLTQRQLLIPSFHAAFSSPKMLHLDFEPNQCYARISPRKHWKSAISSRNRTISYGVFSGLATILCWQGHV